MHGNILDKCFTVDMNYFNSTSIKKQCFNHNKDIHDKIHTYLKFLLLPTYPILNRIALDR